MKNNPEPTSPQFRLAKWMVRWPCNASATWTASDPAELPRAPDSEGCAIANSASRYKVSCWVTLQLF